MYLLTASWMIGYVRPERLASLPIRATTWMLIIGSAVELGLITLQATRGRRSHFNFSTPLDAGIYASMGLFAILFIGAVLPLSWEIARRSRVDAEPVMVFAIVLGLGLTFLFGGGTGITMSRLSSHAIGPEGWRIPVLGWTLRNGDIRISHFFGIHAMQALPLIAWISLTFRGRIGAAVFALGAMTYGALTVGLWAEAIRGRSPIAIAQSILPADAQ